ncbi:hypothetical protein J1780_19650 [Rahnella aceris]|uniref:hypothetical protein n=1 Tax=Rahnella sp. (strain Y9602) TaxID=2703885 RepID=UPI001C25B9EF|nr:hypothetical protein [Rahnella aceris]MBU9842166.1 hypothetical protein [Rahnella aceris]
MRELQYPPIVNKMLLPKCGQLLGFERQFQALDSVLPASADLAGRLMTLMLNSPLSGQISVFTWLPSGGHFYARNSAGDQ